MAAKVGTTFAKDMNKEIDVYAKRGETKEQAIDRVSKAHGDPFSYEALTAVLRKGNLNEIYKFFRQ